MATGAPAATARAVSGCEHDTSFIGRFLSLYRSDVASMPSTAYATGKALMALHTAGVAASDATYQRGVQFLLATQLEDGSWFVKTRALGLQPYFDNGFPRAFDQWISAAGTSWATMALTVASQRTATGSSGAGRD